MDLTLREVEQVLLSQPCIKPEHYASKQSYQRANSTSLNIRQDGLNVLQGLKELSVDYGVLINTAISSITMLVDRKDAFDALCVAARAVAACACKGMTPADRARFCNQHFGRGVTRRELM